MIPTGTSSERWDIDQIPDLHGRVALVTGANSPASIGFHMAYQLALKGAKVYVGARSHDKANNAVKDMKNMASNSQALNLDVFVADMGNVKQVADAARALATKEKRLDILINNAATVIAEDRLDSYGISVSFTINHLGPFTLTRELLPLLKKTALDSPSNDVRVVVVASEVHKACGHRRFRDIEDFNLKLDPSENGQSIRYGYSKLANILFANQLQKGFDKDNVPITAVSLHPGRILTAGALNYTEKFGIETNKEAREAMGIITVEEGSLTALFAATDPIIREEKEKYGAAYLIPFGVIEEQAGPAKDEDLAKELWESSERVVQQILS